MKILRFQSMCIIGSLVFVELALYLLPVGGDWVNVFRPATLSIWSGSSPYVGYAFFNPPWATLFSLFPSLLPEHWSNALFSLVGLIGYFIAFYRMRLDSKTIVLLATTPMFLAALFNPNFDWMVLLGFTLPPMWGLFFVLVKPQIGCMVALFWLVEAWREGGWKRVSATFLPVGTAFLISFLLYGPWFFHMTGALVGNTNAGVWPWGLLVGVPIFTYSLWKRDSRSTLLASPFFSPYVAFCSWFPAAVAASRRWWITPCLWIGSWMLAICVILSH